MFEFDEKDGFSSFQNLLIGIFLLTLLSIFVATNMVGPFLTNGQFVATWTIMWGLGVTSLWNIRGCATARQIAFIGGVVSTTTLFGHMININALAGGAIGLVVSMVTLAIVYHIERNASVNRMLAPIGRRV